MLKILNLYSGIGGNRKNWPEGNEITAIEIDPKIAKIYQDFFPKDKVKVAEAHQYLLEHFKEFDFIWSSPPCPSHSRLRKQISCSVNNSKPVYPDMRLYEEILLLEGYFKGKYCVENVISWYKPLIKPSTLQRHYFWTNFYITDSEFETDSINIGGKSKETDNQQVERLAKKFGYNLDKYDIYKRTLLRNCVNPELGLHIFQEAFRDYPKLF